TLLAPLNQIHLIQRCHIYFNRLLNSVIIYYLVYFANVQTVSFYYAGERFWLVCFRLYPLAYRFVVSLLALTHFVHIVSYSKVICNALWYYLLSILSKFP